MNAVFAHLELDLALVEEAMRDQLTSVSELLGVLGSHVISSGGKRLRPALLLLAAELCGYTGPRRIGVAGAVELLHTATLLHDDVVDLAQLRRGRSSANAVWGNRRAILAGDFFYARASSMIVEEGDLAILDVFSTTIRLMAEGEILQLERSFDPSVTEEHYYRVIDRKSAALLAAACEAGAILGGVTSEERRCLAVFGRELGLAFQLRDDALDYEAGQSEGCELGKRAYADLAEGKVTLPLLRTLERCKVGEREVIGMALKSACQRDGLFEDEGDEDRGPGFDLAPTLELVARYQGVEQTVERACEHAERARNAIADFPDGWARRALLEAARYSVERDL